MRIVHIHRFACFAALSASLLACAGTTLSNDELYHQAYLNVIEATSDKIRPLVCLDHDDGNVTWNEAGDKVLLFTLHHYPSSYPDGKEITFSWGESWLCSVKEYASWAKQNKGNVKDVVLRTKQLLGVEEAKPHTHITSMWLDPAKVFRPAYETDPTKQMALSFAEGTSETYKEWFQGNFYYSYETKRMPWTRLGYTYDWSAEAKDRYGLTEFIAWKDTEAIVEKTVTVEAFFATYSE